MRPASVWAKAPPAANRMNRSAITRWASNPRRTACDDNANQVFHVRIAFNICILQDDKFACEIMAGARGLEPATFGVTGQPYAQRYQRLLRFFLAPKRGGNQPVVRM